MESNIDEKTEQDNKNIKEAIEEYYQSKNTYENNYHENYIKPILKQKQLSNKEKKSLFQKLPKPKCINCKRNVSTIFSIKVDNSYTNHVYSAFCGDTVSPCPLNIKIQMPNVKLIGDILLDNESSYGSINMSKIKIIKAKNDLLFGYLKENEAFNKFEDLTKELEEETKLYEYFVEKFISEYDNVVEKDKLIKEKIELGLNIQQFKSMIKDYNKSNNPQIVYNAVELYINDIEPKLKKIQDLSFSVNKVEYNENEENYFLIQKKYTIEQLEIKYDIAKIDSFIIGTTNTTNTTNNKTLKQTKTKTTKTKKNKPNIVLIQDEEPNEEPNKEQEPNKEPEPNKEQEPNKEPEPND
jgi:hypothetical protein